MYVCAFHSIQQNRYVWEHDCVFSIILHNDVFVVLYLICVNLLHLCLREDVLYYTAKWWTISLMTVTHTGDQMWSGCRWWIIFSYRADNLERLY